MKRPLHFFGVWGFLFILIGLIVFGVLSFQWLFYEMALSNRPLAWASMGLVIIGIQLFSVGLIGEMIVKQSFSTHKNTFQIKEKYL